jgi:hypothetical protein
MPKKAKNKINYNGIQKEIDKNYDVLKSGDYDIYDFTSYISKKYISDVDPIFGERTTIDPYTDLIFAMIELNGLELY